MAFNSLFYYQKYFDMFQYSALLIQDLLELHFFTITALKLLGYLFAYFAHIDTGTFAYFYLHTDLRSLRLDAECL